MFKDLKKDIEYLGSDKKVASEKRRELKRKSEEREALQADLVRQFWPSKIHYFFLFNLTSKTKLINYLLVIVAKNMKFNFFPLRAS